jgi:WD40 repeat protein
MRVIDAFDTPVQTVTVSPDGRFVSATTNFRVRVWDWITGEQVSELGVIEPGRQVFSTDSRWLIDITKNALSRRNLRAEPVGRVTHIGNGFSGGLAISPDGKTLVATRTGAQRDTPLERFSLPDWRPLSGFDVWSPFERLAFSPNGEYIAGINHDSFELRYAASGGINDRQRAQGWGHSVYLTFPRHSEAVVYGWDAEFHVMDTRNGNVMKRVRAAKDQLFLDASFLGSGQQLATVDGSPMMQVWSANSWDVSREYDWDTGGLTCVAVTADGLAGVCGTDTGKLVVFDVDE